MSGTEIPVVVDAQGRTVAEVRPAAVVAATRRPAEAGDGEAAPEEIEHEIDGLRAELTTLVAEIDRRRHEALDVRLQIRRHATTIVTVLAAAGLLYAGAAVLRSYRRERRESARVRASNLARALALLSREDPARLQGALAGRTNPRAAALAALAKVAGAAGRRMVDRAM